MVRQDSNATRLSLPSAVADVVLEPSPSAAFRRECLRPYAKYTIKPSANQTTNRTQVSQWELDKYLVTY